HPLPAASPPRGIRPWPRGWPCLPQPGSRSMQEPGAARHGWLAPALGTRRLGGGNRSRVGDLVLHVRPTAELAARLGDVTRGRVAARVAGKEDRLVAHATAYRQPPAATGAPVLDLRSACAAERPEP